MTESLVSFFGDQSCPSISLIADWSRVEQNILIYLGLFFARTLARLDWGVGGSQG